MLSEALRINSTLVSLDLQYNTIGDVGARSLSEAIMTNPTFTRLDLRDNSYGELGVQTLSRLCKANSSLKIKYTRF